MGKRRAVAGQWVVWGVLALAAAGCNSGGGSSSTVTGVGLEMPTEVSAVPASGSGGSKMVAAMMALGAAADPGTDYTNAQTVRFVNEPTIEQFEIISEILDALAQTHYADAENIGAGAYKAMIAFQDEKDGVATKTLEPWVVQSDVITEGGQAVLRVRLWIEENDGGMVRTIKAEVKIYEAATKNSDGSYADYGVWTINAKMSEDGANFFAASADRGSNGETILQLHELMDEGPGFTHEVKAYLNKSDTTGHGKVEYPDWNSCTNWPCTPTATTATYAYNSTHLGVQQGSDPAQYKDRTAVTALTNRYGLFDSVTGDDVLKTLSFGFPVRYTDGDGTHFAYYGAWQGRHQLWSNGGTVPDGTTVTREDHGANQTAQQYTTASFTGTLTKRTMVAADIADVTNLPFQIWINQNAGLIYRTSDSSWHENQCQPPPGGCTESPDAFDLNKLVVESNNNQKFVNINRFVMGSGMVQYMYDPAGDTTFNPNNNSGPGFYVLTGSPPNFTSSGTLLTPTDGMDVWANIGGSIYIEYQGEPTGWVEKELVNFNQQTWTPEFGDGTNDRPFTLDLNREYYINNQGANYVVKKTNDSPVTYETMIELQSVANPVNVATVLSGVDHFRAQWGGNTYTFDTDPTSPTFLKLLYGTGTDNQGNAVTAGAVVEDGQWGLVAQDAGDNDLLDGNSRPVQFNWEYPRDGETWGIMTYLIDSNSDYHLLDDPVALAPVTLTNGAGDSKTLSLRYDGWMHGLPNLFEELRKNDFVVTSDIADKIINIPAGTEVTDATDSSQSYVIKPLEVSEFLEVVADPGTLGAAMTSASAVDLDTVPDFVEHGMGAMPSVDAPKYSEGNLIE
ncbi:MAG: hypothetical protein ACOYXR_12485 [Nitrospirota bacterium]